MLGGDIKEIKIISGETVIVNECEYDYLSQWNWNFNKQRGYVYRVTCEYCHKCKHKIQKTIYLHREVMRARPNEIVDHINHNTLLNTYENLRVCTKAQNCYNQRKPHTNKPLTSKYKGVHFDKDSQKWRAVITCNGVKEHLGRFKSENEAGIAYNKRAIEVHGKFAHLNIIGGEHNAPQ